MSTIPKTTKEFERFFEQHKAEWPQELQDQGYRVLFSLRMIDLNKNNPSALAAAKRINAPDIEKFATDLAAWAARSR